MELLLNLIWLVTAVGLTSVVFARARRQEGFRDRWIPVIAVLSLCVLLFPAISITDDLQQVALAGEESAARFLLSDAHHRPHSGVVLESLLALIVLFQAAQAFVAYCRRRAYACRPALKGFLAAIISRPPPTQPSAVL